MNINMKDLADHEERKMRELISHIHAQQKQDNLATWFVVIPTLIAMIVWIA